MDELCSLQQRNSAYVNLQKVFAKTTLMFPIQQTEAPRHTDK